MAVPGGEAVKNAFAMVKAHVCYIPVVFLADAAEDGAERFDVCEAGACDFRVRGFEGAADEERCC